MTIHFFVNKSQYDNLPNAYKIAFGAACKAATVDMKALYDVNNTYAIRSLVSKGIKFLPLPRDVMDSVYKFAFEFYAEHSGKHPAWGKNVP